MSRFLLNPCNNTLSHLAKCLALRERLEARGHEVLLTVSGTRAAFLDRLGVDRYFVLPDIQEADPGPTPHFSWFRPDRVEACVRAEVRLLKQLKPDATLGVFRFTGPLSAQLADIPYASLICGSMTPACDEVLGFSPGEVGAEAQAAALHFFRETCALRMRPALDALGLAPVTDVWRLLVGRRTLLWDFPEFQPLPDTPGYHHVGPPRWSGWPRPDDASATLDRLEGPIAYVAFGTGGVSAGMLRHLLDALWRLGYAVALALGGQAVELEFQARPAKLAVFDFLPAERILARAALVACHGGQLLVFEALRWRVPILVLPLQPEQAQNGVCVERLGCGKRLLRGLVFDGRDDASERAFLERPVAALADEMAAALADARLPNNLELASRQLDHYRGAETLAALLEVTA